MFAQIPVDGEHLNVDALLIHHLKSPRPKDVVAGTAAQLGQRRTCDDVLYGDDAVRVGVDDSNAPAIHHHLTSCRLTLTCGGGSLEADPAHDVRSRRAG